MVASYGLEPSGTLFPITGEGFFQLSRGAYVALGVYRTHGLTERAEQIVAKLHNVGPIERSEALAVFRAVGDEGPEG